MRNRGILSPHRTGPDMQVLDALPRDRDTHVVDHNATNAAAAALARAYGIPETSKFKPKNQLAPQAPAMPLHQPRQTRKQSRVKIELTEDEYGTVRDHHGRLYLEDEAGDYVLAIQPQRQVKMEVQEESGEEKEEEEPEHVHVAQPSQYNVAAQPTASQFEIKTSIVIGNNPHLVWQEIYINGEYMFLNTSSGKHEIVSHASTGTIKLSPEKVAKMKAGKTRQAAEAQAQNEAIAERQLQGMRKAEREEKKEE